MWVVWLECDIMLDLARPAVLAFGGRVGLAFFYSSELWVAFVLLNLPVRFLLLKKNQTTNESLLPVRLRPRTGSTRG